MSEITQVLVEALKEHPTVGVVVLGFVYFVALDIAAALRKPRITNVDEIRYTRKDKDHGQNRRGEGMED